MTSEKRPKPLGPITRMETAIAEPLKMNFSLDINALNIYVGKNGSGKSFLNVMTFCMQHVANCIIITRSIDSSLYITDLAQFIFDKSYSNQNVHGSVKMTWGSGADMIIIFDNGRIGSIEYAGFEDINEPTNAMYLSSSTRLFTNIAIYLKMRKIVAAGKSSEEILAAMCEYYKYYDVYFIERLIQACPISNEKVVAANLVNMDESFREIYSIDVDLEKGEFFAMVDVVPGKDGEMTRIRKDLSTYGNGHQAMISIFVGGLVH